MDERVADMSALRGLDAIAALGELEQRVVIWRFGLFGQPELSITEIARRLNMHPGAARTIEKRALRKVARGAGRSRSAA